MKRWTVLLCAALLVLCLAGSGASASDDAAADAKSAPSIAPPSLAQSEAATDEKAPGDAAAEEPAAAQEPGPPLIDEKMMEQLMIGAGAVATLAAMAWAWFLYECS